MGEAVVYKAVLPNGMEFTFPDGEVPEVGAEYFFNGKFYIVTSVDPDGTVQVEESRRKVIELKPQEVSVPAKSQ